MEKLPSSFVSAMKHFFGFKEGQTLSQFSAELKELGPADREYFIVGLRQNGYPIPADVAAAAAA